MYSYIKLKICAFYTAQTSTTINRQWRGRIQGHDRRGDDPFEDRRDNGVMERIALLL